MTRGVRSRHAEMPREVKDAIMDLEEWTTDTERHVTTAVAGEAIAALRHCYNGTPEAWKQAYAAVSALKRRNSRTFGDDIPVNHTTNYCDFQNLCDGLIDCLLRDFAAERGRGR